MDKSTLRRIGWIGASLGLTSVLVGCNDMATQSSEGDSASASSTSSYINDDNGLQALNGLGGLNGLNSQNGLNAQNGLNSQNGLNAQNGYDGHNGLNSQNGLNGQNGLGSINGYPGKNGFNAQNGFNVMNGFTAQNGLGSINGVNFAAGMASQNGIGENAGLMTSSSGRDVVKYLAKCALPATDSLVKKDQTGTNYTFAGSLGLAPQWKDANTGSCDQACTEALSACMMAHINTSGVHIPLWMVGPESSVGWGQSPWYPTREGTFFGQMMLINYDNNLDAYYCNGPGTDQNVVPGRLGFNQGSVPYLNAWPKSAGMDGLCDTSHSTGTCTKHALSSGETTTDGPDSCTLNGVTYNSPLTVWRGQTFQAEAAEGGAWLTSGGNACTPGTSGCSWNKGGLGFIAGNCTTPGSNGCAIIVDSKNGNGKRVGYFNGASKGLKFTGVNVACSGAAQLVAFTTNGDTIGTTNRRLSFIVNGGTPQTVTFTGAEDWSNPVGTTVNLTGFNQGTNNTIYITADSSHGAPDVDWIEIVNSGGSCAAGQAGTCTTSAWHETSSVNSSTSDEGDDGNLSSRFTTGRAMAVGDSYQVDFTGLVSLTGITLNNTQTSANDFAAKYDVYASNDGSSWSKIVSAAPGAANSTTISFSKTQMRYIKVQVNTVNSNYWSIGEFQVNGCTLN